jgi:hypothetical protein
MAKNEKKSYAQVKKIWASARELKIDSQELHKIVEDVTGKKSIAKLSRYQAKEVIEELIELGASPGMPVGYETRGKNRIYGELPANVIELPSPEQMKFIEGMRKEIGWDDAYFSRVLKRVIKKDKILTKADARKVAQAMGKIEKNKQKEIENDAG